MYQIKFYSGQSPTAIKFYLIIINYEKRTFKKN